MRAEGQGWVVWQPGDDEDEAVNLAIIDTLAVGDGWAETELTQPEAQKLYDALGDALGNMTPEEK